MPEKIIIASLAIDISQVEQQIAQLNNKLKASASDIKQKVGGILRDGTPGGLSGDFTKIGNQVSGLGDTMGKAFAKASSFVVRYDENMDALGSTLKAVTKEGHALSVAFDEKDSFAGMTVKYQTEMEKTKATITSTKQAVSGLGTAYSKLRTAMGNNDTSGQKYWADQVNHYKEVINNATVAGDATDEYVKQLAE